MKLGPFMTIAFCTLAGVCTAYGVTYIPFYPGYMEVSKESDRLLQVLQAEQIFHATVATNIDSISADPSRVNSIQEIVLNIHECFKGRICADSRRDVVVKVPATNLLLKDGTSLARFYGNQLRQIARSEPIDVDSLKKFGEASQRLLDMQKPNGTIRISTGQSLLIMIREGAHSELAFNSSRVSIITEGVSEFLNLLQSMDRIRPLADSTISNPEPEFFSDYPECMKFNPEAVCQAIYGTGSPTEMELSETAFQSQFARNYVSAMDYGFAFHREELVLSLVKAGASSVLLRSDERLLELAAFANFPSVIEYLATNRKSLAINATNSQGSSPLEIALMVGSHAAALELIKQGASFELLQQKNGGRVLVIPGTSSLLDSLNEGVAFGGLDDLELSVLQGDIRYGTVNNVAISIDKNRSLFNRALSEESNTISVLISAITNSPLMYLTVLANGLNLCKIQISSELRLQLSKHVEENWGLPFQSLWFKACQ